MITVGIKRIIIHVCSRAHKRNSKDGSFEIPLAKRQTTRPQRASIKRCIYRKKAIAAEVQAVLASVDKKRHTCRRSYLFPFRMETFARVLQSKWLYRHGTHECIMPHALTVKRSKVSIFSACGAPDSQKNFCWLQFQRKFNSAKYILMVS